MCLLPIIRTVLFKQTRIISLINIIINFSLLESKISAYLLLTSQLSIMSHLLCPISSTNFLVWFKNKLMCYYATQKHILIIEFTSTQSSQHKQFNNHHLNSTEHTNSQLDHSKVAQVCKNIQHKTQFAQIQET